MKDQTIEQYYSLLISLLQGKMIQIIIGSTTVIGQFSQIHKHIDAGIELINCIFAFGQTIKYHSNAIAIDVYNPSNSGNCISTIVTLVADSIVLTTTNKNDGTEKKVEIIILGNVYSEKVN